MAEGKQGADYGRARTEGLTMLPTSQQDNQKATLTPEQRADLETLLRNQIACVRATCRLLGRPAPLISRDDTRHERMSLPKP